MNAARNPVHDRDIRLLALERADRIRLVITWVTRERRHLVDVREERLNVDGAWVKTARGIELRVSEIFRVQDAIAIACRLAHGVSQ